MRGLGYWLDTFLSRPIEVATALLAILVFAAAGLSFSDRQDLRAVVVGIGLLTVALAVFGPRYLGEWHYWVGTGTIAVVGILVIDSR